MTALDIANLALRRVGDLSITAFNQAGSTAARKALEFFPMSIDEVVSEPLVAWTFAKHRAELVRDDVSANLTSFTYRYTPPADALRILATDPLAQYEIEGGALYSDLPEINAVYIRSIVDLTTPDAPEIVTGVTLPPKVASAVGYKLAAHLALALGKLDRIGVLEQKYMMTLQEAQGVDALQSPGLDSVPTYWEDIQ